VRDVQPCGEVANGELGAAGGGGLQEEQLAGLVGDGSIIVNQNNQRTG